VAKWRQGGLDINERLILYRALASGVYINNQTSATSSLPSHTAPQISPFSVSLRLPVQSSPTPTASDDNEQRTIIQQYGALLAVPNVTAHPTTASVYQLHIIRRHATAATPQHLIALGSIGRHFHKSEPTPTKLAHINGVAKTSVNQF